MKQFQYVITDELGLHARPAGQLVKVAAGFAGCDIKVGTETKMVDAKRIMGVMQLGAKKGTALTITCEGADEEAAAEKLEAFLKENL